MSERTLSDADVAALADALAPRLADALAQTPPAQAPRLAGAAEVAMRFGVSRDFVYANADRIGVVRIGEGPRPRLRFDLDAVAEQLSACSTSKGSRERDPAPRAKPKRPGARSGRKSARLLPITPVRGSK